MQAIALDTGSPRPAVRALPLQPLRIAEYNSSLRPPLPNPSCGLPGGSSRMRAPPSGDQDELHSSAHTSPPRNPVPLTVSPPSGRISTGRAEEQPFPLALRRPLLILVSGPVGPVEHPPGVLSPRREFLGRDRLRTS